MCFGYYLLQLRNISFGAGDYISDFVQGFEASNVNLEINCAYNEEHQLLLRYLHLF